MTRDFAEIGPGRLFFESSATKGGQVQIGHTRAMTDKKTYFCRRLQSSSPDSPYNAEV